MSKIEPINIYQARTQQIRSKLANSPSFEGNINSATKSAEELAVQAYKGIEQGLGRFGKVASFLHKHDGEVQAQLGNAIFTTTLAPLFIAANPLSKEDQNTKLYSAIRQPLSAGIAIAAGLGMTMPANNFIEAMASKGALSAIDLRMAPDDSFLKREYKRLAKSGKTNGQTQEEYIENAKNEAKKLFTKLITEDPAKLKNDNTLKQQVRKLDDYISKNNLHEVDFKSFMKENFDTKFYNSAEGSGLKEAAFEKQLNKIKAIDFLRKMGLVDKKCSEEELRAFISRRRGSNLEDAFKDAKIKGDSAYKITEEIGKLNARQIQYNVNGEIIKQESLTLKQMLQALKIEDKFKKDIETKKVSAVLNDFSKVHLNGLNSMKGKGLQDFATNILSNKTAITKANYGVLKKYYGIAVALASLPISCGALNWIYPRFVEKFFPKIAHAKAKKSNNKTQEGGQK